MTGVVVAVVGGLVWIGLRGHADVATFLVGAAISVMAARTTRLPWRGRVSPLRWLRGLGICGELLFYFVIDLMIANARQLRIVLAPKVRVRPRWVRFTTSLERPASRQILGVLISLTPGTVTEEIRGNEVVVHVLDAASDDDPLAVIRDRIEAPLLRLEAL